MKMWGKPRTASPSPPTSRHSGMPPMSPFKDGSEKHGNKTKGICHSERGHPRKQAFCVDDSGSRQVASTKTGPQRGWLGLQAGLPTKKPGAGPIEVRRLEHGWPRVGKQPARWPDLRTGGTVCRAVRRGCMAASMIFAVKKWITKHFLR